MTETQAADADLQTPNAAQKPVLNTPFDEPTCHWIMNSANRATKPDGKGRRQSLSILPVPKEKSEEKKAGEQLFDDVNIPVQEMRKYVKTWRSRNYEGATEISRQLLEHWTTEDDREGKRLFFAQIEAIETLIYLTEVAEQMGGEQAQLMDKIETSSKSLNDGISRLCVKMATGTGKTVVMGMTIAWHALNAAFSHGLTDEERGRYQTCFIAITPGLTVKERLAVLKPSHPDNVYDQMNLVPKRLRHGLNRADVGVFNFQKFQQATLFSGREKTLIGIQDEDNKEDYSAMLRRVLKGMSGMQDGQKICVINDEAHHCYLPKQNGKPQDEDKQAALWFSAIKGLDNLGHLGAVYDYSATPLFIATASNKKTDMFPWVVSDYPLTDAIEAGLVKIPRFPVSDDTNGNGAGSVKWRNLFKSSKDATGKTALDKSNMPQVLKDAVDATYEDYKNVDSNWKKKNASTPPVMIVVADNITNAETLYTWLGGDHELGKKTKRKTTKFDLFDNKEAWVGLAAHEAEQSNGGSAASSNNTASGSPPVRTLLVHSRIENDETGSGPMKELLVRQAQLLRPGSAKKDAAPIMREALNTVGKRGGLGENVRCVVSVSMLTEGWDTKTVTHVVGYRAFGTQLLCEQVTGRALRRTTYDSFDERGMLTPQFAEVIGIPFDFTAHDASQDNDPIEPPEAYEVRSLPERRKGRVMFWPNVSRYYWPAPSLEMEIDTSQYGTFRRPADLPTIAELAGVVGGEKLIGINRDARMRLNTAATKLTGAVVMQLRHLWEEGKLDGQDEDTEGYPLAAKQFQYLSSHVREWLADPSNGLARDEYYMLQDGGVLQAAVSAILPAVKIAGTESNQAPIAEFGRPSDTLTTDNVNFLTSIADHYPTDNTKTTKKSHLNLAVCDSQLEVAIARLLDSNKHVDAWVRNFHLGWTIPWYNETRRRWSNYVPDFVARIGGGAEDAHAVHLILEGKGQPTPESEAKKYYAKKIWIPAVEAGSDQLGRPQNWAFVELVSQGQLGTHRDNIKVEFDEAVAECYERSQNLKTQAD